MRTNMDKYDDMFKSSAQMLANMSALPKEEAHKRLFHICTGRTLDYDNVRDYNEKLQWLIVKRYDRNVSAFADKLAVRDYVRSCGLEKLLPQIYGVYERAEDIEYDSLPPKCIIKANHGSGEGFYAILNRKGIKAEYESKQDTFELNKKLNRALKSNYFYAALEYHYKHIRPRLFAEELIVEKDHVSPTDYKVYCFSGEPRYIKVISDRGTGVFQSYYDAEWNRCDMIRDEYKYQGDIPRPVHLKEMLFAAAKLSEPFPTARVDFYDNGDKLYFGELTLTPAAGLNRTDKVESLLNFGKLTDLSHWESDKLDFARTSEQATLTLLSLFKRLLRASEGSGEGQSIEQLSEDRLHAIMSDACFILGSDAPNEHKNICLDVLYKAAFLDNLSLEECWQIYWNLNRAMFLNHNLTISKGSLRALYRHIFEFVHANMDYSGKRYRDIKERSSCVIILTSQFLKPGHAPTTRVLDYALTLKKQDFKPVIINDAGMNYFKYPYLRGVADFNFREDCSELNTYEYAGESFEFFQVSVQMPNLQVIGLLLDNIYELNPLFVYNIGASCLTADLCDDFVTTASLPCSFSLPVSECRNLLVGRNIEQRDYADLSDGQRIIETNFNYVFHPYTVSYSRREFGIAEDAFLITIVGNRLGEELDESFLGMLNHTLIKSGEQKLDICVAIVGEIADVTSISSCFDESVTDRVIFTGGLEMAGSFIALANLNINPDRSGGGRAHFEAMHESVPVLSLRKGDAYFCGGTEFGADDYASYSEIILKYATDKSFYDEMSKKARARAAQLEDIEGTLKRAVADILSKEAT